MVCRVCRGASSRWVRARCARCLAVASIAKKRCTSKKKPWALWQRLRTLKHPLRRRCRRSLYLQTVDISGGHAVHIVHDFKKSADAHARATTQDHAAFFGSSGSVLWSASMTLIKWLGANPDTLQNLVVGASILELGSGVGFLGTALRKLGATRVLMTDLPSQQRQLRQNLAANREAADRSAGLTVAADGALRLRSPRVSCCSYAWGDPLPSQLLAHDWDLIVGCEVVYVYRRSCLPLGRSHMLHALCILPSSPLRGHVCMCMPCDATPLIPCCTTQVDWWEGVP